MGIRFVGWEDPLEKEIANQLQGSCLVNPRTEEAGGLQSVGLQRVGRDLVIKQQQQSFKNYYYHHHHHLG